MTANEHKITLDSGICFDFTNLFGAQRLTPEDVKTMDAKIASAQETIKKFQESLDCFNQHQDYFYDIYKKETNV